MPSQGTVQDKQVQFIFIKMLHPSSPSTLLIHTAFFHFSLISKEPHRHKLTQSNSTVPLFFQYSIHPHFLSLLPYFTSSSSIGLLTVMWKPCDGYAVQLQQLWTPSGPYNGRCKILPSELRIITVDTKALLLTKEVIFVLYCLFPLRHCCFKWVL